MLWRPPNTAPTSPLYEERLTRRPRPAQGQDRPVCEGLAAEGDRRGAVPQRLLLCAPRRAAAAVRHPGYWGVLCHVSSIMTCAEQSSLICCMRNIHAPACTVVLSLQVEPTPPSRHPAGTKTRSDGSSLLAKRLRHGVMGRAGASPAPWTSTTSAWPCSGGRSRRPRCATRTSGGPARGRACCAGGPGAGCAARAPALGITGGSRHGARCDAREGMWCMSGECDRSMGCIAYGPIPTLTVQGINVQVLGCVSNAEPRWPSVVIADTRGAQSDVENDRINVAVKL